MREIKFRAWHPESKSMTVFDLEKASKDQYIASHVCALLSNTHIEGKGLMMQFTGLTDKNGAEIYEGDIVKHIKGYVWAVIFETNESRFALKCKAPLIRPLFKDRASNLEVIGNIYENPDLLGDL
tara:strand:- start:7710 stop:8084 length:375 start_codon:yes stop_codon:yes gene_type:complete